MFCGFLTEIATKKFRVTEENGFASKVDFGDNEFRV